MRIRLHNAFPVSERHVGCPQFPFRDKLEKLHIVCRLLKSLILNHFKERHCGSFPATTLTSTWQAKERQTRLRPLTGQWLIGTAPSPITSEWMTLLGPKHLRVGTTKLHLGKHLTTLKLLPNCTHSDICGQEELGLVQNWYIKDIVGISLEAVLSDQQLISCRLLSLDVKLDSMGEGYTATKEFQTIVDVVEHQVDNSNSKTIFVFPLSIYPDALLEACPGYASPAFRLLVNCSVDREIHRQFRLINNRTMELLRLREKLIQEDHLLSETSSKPDNFYCLERKLI
uniref:Uncharacterized protein n=1 Tax=Ditylenchus dipsaci TaxID=166011 RepID=A0A915D675_9BILA